MRQVLVLNGEARHCYREKPGHPEEEALAAEERKEAQSNAEAARLWICPTRLRSALSARS